MGIGLNWILIFSNNLISLRTDLRSEIGCFVNILYFARPSYGPQIRSEIGCFENILYYNRPSYGPMSTPHQTVYLFRACRLAPLCVLCRIANRWQHAAQHTRVRYAASSHVCHLLTRSSIRCSRLADIIHLKPTRSDTERFKLPVPRVPQSQEHDFAKTKKNKPGCVLGWLRNNPLRLAIEIHIPRRNVVSATHDRVLSPVICLYSSIQCLPEEGC